MPTEPSAAYWHDKVEESRALAAAMSHGPSRDTMLRIAADYEKMAEFDFARHPKKPCCGER